MGDKKRNTVQRIVDGDKKQSFVNVAEYRTEVVCDALRKLATCGDRARYECTEAQINEIAASIAKAAAAAIETLRTGKRETAATFKFAKAAE